MAEEIEKMTERGRLAKRISKLKAILRKLERAIEKASRLKKMRDDVRRLENAVKVKQGTLKKIYSQKNKSKY